MVTGGVSGNVVVELLYLPQTTVQIGKQLLCTLGLLNMCACAIFTLFVNVCRNIIFQFVTLFQCAIGRFYMFSARFESLLSTPMQETLQSYMTCMYHVISRFISCCNLHCSQLRAVATAPFQLLSLIFMCNCSRVWLLKSSLHLQWGFYSFAC